MHPRFQHEPVSPQTFSIEAARHTLPTTILCYALPVRGTAHHMRNPMRGVLLGRDLRPLYRRDLNLRLPLNDRRFLNAMLPPNVAKNCRLIAAHAPHTCADCTREILGPLDTRELGQPVGAVVRHIFRDDPCQQRVTFCD